MPHGYNGKILHVNLTNSSWEIEEPGDVWYRTYMGGSNFVSYYLLKELKRDVDPLSADNILIFACSVVTGAPISGFNRYTVAAKSPLTGGFGEAEAGGYWGPELKFAGFDAVIIKGRAPKPVYLWLHNGDVEIRDAVNVWGKNNWETLETIQEEVADKRVRVASIGPAGENLIPFANVQNDLEHFNGRTGMGAVLGSKNLKAIAVRGTKKMTFADPDKVKEISRWLNDRIKTHPPNVALTKYGTPGLVDGLNNSGILPTHNFRDGVFDGVDKINAKAYHETIFHSSSTCYACSVRCKRRVAFDDEKYPLDPRFGGAEYETLACLGSLLENDNLPALARGNQICNLMGIDTIATGCTIAFAMECFEKGIITEKDTGGIPIRFGDADVMISLIEDIVNRRGFGKILSLGVKGASEKIGNGSEKYAFHIKGSELPAHDGRGKTGMAMGYALCATGSDHVECPHDTAFQQNVGSLESLGILEPVRPLDTDYDKVRYFSLGQKAWGINNCLCLCNFCSVPIHAMTFQGLVDAVTAITGWKTSLFELMRVVERSDVMSRIFNNKEGFSPKDDRVIRRWHEDFDKGPMKGKHIDKKEFQDAIELFYEVSGWDKEGRPTRGKLVDLNLDWLVE